ncbi:MAG: HK97 gp10 family phage protein [Oscillospiraceae bacterium]|nr:HK97 gp10 family phage protein [Oscillospiraceae bacterium]
MKNRNIVVDFSQINGFLPKLEQLGRRRDAFFRSSAKVLAGMLLRAVKEKTPIGQYTEESGKNGGTLKRGWTGGADTDVTAFVSTMRVADIGNGYEITMENPVYYAPYVEFGHRQQPGRYVPQIGKRLTASYVEGKHMLEKAVNEVEPRARGVLEQQLEKFLREALEGGAGT